MLPLLNIPVIWFFLPSISLFFLLPYFSEHYLFTLFHFASLCQFSPCGSPLCPLHLDLLFSLPPTHSPVSLSMPLFLVTFVFPLHHLTPFIPRCLSHPFISLLFFSSPSLFPVSVEPLWLHRYSDCWLCCRGGMLFRHSIRRYCTTCTLPLTIKTTAHNIPLLFIHCTMSLSSSWNVSVQKTIRVSYLSLNFIETLRPLVDSWSDKQDIFEGQLSFLGWINY